MQNVLDWKFDKTRPSESPTEWIWKSRGPKSLRGPHAIFRRGGESTSKFEAETKVENTAYKLLLVANEICYIPLSGLQSLVYYYD